MNASKKSKNSDVIRSDTSQQVMFSQFQTFLANCALLTLEEGDSNFGIQIYHEMFEETI